MIELPAGDTLLVVPPLAHLSWPNLGVHVLQGVGRRRGHEVGVLYANLWFAARIGVVAYANLCNAPGAWLLGERLFAAAAGVAGALDRPGFLGEVEAHHRRAPPGPLRYLDHLTDAALQDARGGTRYDIEALRALAGEGAAFVDEVSEAVARRGYRAVGVSTSFDQTNAAVALLAAVKRRAPGITTLIGGANCEGPMAGGVAALSPLLDHVFDGESETTFPDVLDALREGTRCPRVLRGTPCRDLDSLPCPDYADYFAARARFVPGGDAPTAWLSYETSRGCWWGARSHCTFCGLNGQGLGFRQKSPERVLDDLEAMLRRYPARHVCMTDNIMPHAFHRTLVPRMRERLPDIHVFYEQKANLTLPQLRALVDAGIRAIQPGIESLATPLLRRMRKGVTGRQNLLLLRNARVVGAHVKWNLLYGLPGDEAEPYATMLGWMPLLRHLAPPIALTHLSLDRFSPYHAHPAEHGISELRPLPVYREVFGPDADSDALAYHFDGTWESGSLAAPALMRRLWDGVTAWRLAWDTDHPPTLYLARRGPGRWVLLDTRGAGDEVWDLSPGQAHAVAVGGPKDRVAAASWAVERGFAIDTDGWCVPLALAAYGDLVALAEAAPSSDWVTVLPARLGSDLRTPACAGAASGRSATAGTRRWPTPACRDRRRRRGSQPGTSSRRRRSPPRPCSPGRG